MSTVSRTEEQPILVGQRVAFAGKLEGPTKREAVALVRQHGGTPVDSRNAPTVLVVGVGQLLNNEQELLDEPTRQAAERGELRIVSETEFWEWLDPSHASTPLSTLYTPAMLAELVHVPLATIRRWHRRKLIVPVRVVHQLPYFDFEQVVAARHLANLLASGVTPATLERKLAALSRFVKGVDRSLQQLAVMVEGRQILLRHDEGLVEPSGQLRFDFDAVEQDSAATPAAARTINLEELRSSTVAPASVEEMLDAACEYEESGQLELAIEMYRAALAAGGPKADLCFQLAELLYRVGDVNAARERYFMAIELDESFLEARASLGCVLAESGDLELAVAAFQGALLHHPDYVDVHYHLARSLGELGRGEEARREWEAFLRLAPDSPWADEARRWLGLDQSEAVP